ncbi:hypothetical protein [Longimicrobium sp.]|uniref:hypothetical protein n=1 Tax=Longimicrobium sp. TaxID=2029185 RepID=UPI002BAD9AC9|nr:hypothetical protein [Longimicrobium sp.]HSU16085.1 hypothetical protein [Longimicrobium sp.]
MKPPPVLGRALGALAWLAGGDARALNARLSGARVRLEIGEAADPALAGATVEGIIREILPDAVSTAREARRKGAVAVIHLDPHPRITWREVAVHGRDAGCELWMARWIPVAVHVHPVDRARPARLGESAAAATATMRLTFIAREPARMRDPAAAGAG